MLWQLVEHVSTRKKTGENKKIKEITLKDLEDLLNIEPKDDKNENDDGAERSPDVVSNQIVAEQSNVIEYKGGVCNVGLW